MHCVLHNTESSVIEAYYSSDSSFPLQDKAERDETIESIKSYGNAIVLNILPGSRKHY